MTSRNDLAYSRIVTEQAQYKYKRTVDQCRAKIKTSKTKYKQIADKLSRNSTGRELGKESQKIIGVSIYTSCC